jgi:sulfur-oxidizing protein SoxX
MKKTAIMIAAISGICGLSAGALWAEGMAKLARYKVTDGIAIAKPLSAKPGDAANGRKVMANRKKGNCLACHKIDQMKEIQFHGEIGPELSDIAGRMPAGQIRLRLVDPKSVNAETIMPAMYKNEGLHRVRKKFIGKTILSAQEVEDVIAFMMTLKKP